MPPAPGWQTVFELLETHRQESREDHLAINQRLRALENAELTRISEQLGAQKAQNRIFGLGKTSIAIVISIFGAVIQVVGALAHTTPPSTH